MNVYIWTDSLTILALIKTSANLLQTFLANLVAEFQHLTNTDGWNHVPSEHFLSKIPEMKAKKCFVTNVIREKFPF